MKTSFQPRKSGFTLVETVIAMGIITIMITAFLAAFGPAVQGIRKSISSKEANRLASSLEVELSVLRPDEAGTGVGQFSTAFEKAFNWIQESGGSDRDSMVLIYQYRGNPSDIREDGTLEPIIPNADDIPGEDFVIQSVVRRFGDDEVEEELQPRIVEGRVFFVRMSQLIFTENGELTLTDQPGTIRGHNPPNNEVISFEAYPDAVIAVQAEFFVMQSSLFAFVSNTFDPENPGRPVFTRNLGIVR